MKFQPKTDWKYDDTPTEADFNRIEQGIADALEGNDPIIQQDTPPDGVKEGRLWLDTSDDTYQGTVFESLKGEIGGHLGDEVKHIKATERTKWNNAQLYKLTNDFGQRTRLIGADLLTVKPGMYYGTASGNTNVPPEIATDQSWYFIDITESDDDAKGANQTHRLRRIIMQRSYDNSPPWIGNIHTDGTLRGWNQLASAKSPIAMLFGNGTDGNATINGTTTLVRDMCYNNLTINAGATLNTGGFKVYVKNKLINNGTIAANGGDGGNGVSGGGSTIGGISPGGGNGGGGKSSTSDGYGVSGANSTGAGGNGGIGGSASGSSVNGGGGRGTSVGFTQENAVETQLLFKLYNVSINGGGGGGGGGAQNMGNGGAGGGGGGRLYVFANSIVNNGSLEAKGGNGGNGWGNGGGGGGGGGGFAMIVFNEYQGANPNVSKGLAGAGGSLAFKGPDTDSFKVAADGENGMFLKIKITI